MLKKLVLLRREREGISVLMQGDLVLARGRTDLEALGRHILSHPRAFGIEIEYQDEAPDSEKTNSR